MQHAQDPTSDQTIALTIELGRARIAPDAADELTEGSLVVLEQSVSEPVDVYANDRLVAQGEIVIVEDRFCVKVTKLVTHVNAIA